MSHAGLDPDEFDLRADRKLYKRELAAIYLTLEGEMWTFKMFYRFLENLGAAEHGLASAVHIPDLDPEDRSSDVKLHSDRATAMLAHFREDDALYGSRRHAYLELAWTTGARQGRLRALDLQDLYSSERYIEFRHRPDTDTPLKNKRGGERPVGLKQTSVDAITYCIRNDRAEKADDHGRQQLPTTIQGRPSSSVVRTWSYTGRRNP